MASLIETALYGQWSNRIPADGHVGEHCLVEFSLRRDSTAITADILRIGVVPEVREYHSPTVAEFYNAHLGQVLQTDYDLEFNYLPWSIIGFHCVDHGKGDWSFQLNCDSIRVQWSSKWPTIAHGDFRED